MKNFCKKFCFAKLQTLQILFFAWIRQDESCHLIPMKPKLLFAISKRPSWMGLRITCLGFKLTEKSQFSDRNEGCVSFHNKKMTSPTILSNQNKQRSEILSEPPLVGCDYTIPCRKVSIVHRSNARDLTNPIFQSESTFYEFVPIVIYKKQMPIKFPSSSFHYPLKSLHMSQRIICTVFENAKSL